MNEKIGNVKKSSGRNGLENNSRKNVNNNDGFFKVCFDEFSKFYKEHLKIKHIVILIIMIILYVLFLNSRITSLKVLSADEISKVLSYSTGFFNSLLRDDIVLVFMIIFAGISPFLYISIIGMIASYNVALSVSLAYMAKNSIFTLILGSVGGVIQIIGYSLAIAVGIYYCGLSSKRFRYSQSSSFGFLDVKRAVYNLRKKEKEVEKIDKQKMQKELKHEKLNVKVPYKMFAYVYIVSVVIVAIGLLIVR